MYYITASSSSSLLRASRVTTSRFFSRAFAGGSLSSPASSSSYSPAISAAARAGRSRGFSAAAAAARWSRGSRWSSPYSVRSQIGAVAPAIEQFQRKIASMGKLLQFRDCLQSQSACLFVLFCFVFSGRLVLIFLEIGL